MRHAVPRAAAIAALIGSSFAIAPAGAAEQLATVISSTPVTAQVPVARQSCTDTQQLVQPAPSGAGAVIGAIAGGVIGNQFGGGAGRAAATGLGAVAGSVIGNQAEVNANPPTEVPVRRCGTVTRYENRVVGYDVVYEYAGQRYSTRMARDPGSQFAVTVRPADGAGTNLPAPAPDAAPQMAYESAPPPVYYAPAPYYYSPYPYYGPPVYVGPTIGIGFGYYYGGGHRHWR